MSQNKEEVPNINLINEFNRISENHKIIIGPLKDEHDYLINNFTFYKKAFNQNKMAFCSDFYRFWKASLSKNQICYADITIEFDIERLNNFLNFLEENSLSFFVLESPLILWSGFWVSCNLNDIFKKIFFNYAENKKICSSPIELTKNVRKKIKYKAKKEKNYGNFKVLIKTINFLKLDLRNNLSFIKINPKASWLEKKTNAKELWEKKFLNFKKNKTLLRDYIFLKLPRWIQVRLIK